MKELYAKVTAFVKAHHRTAGWFVAGFLLGAAFL